MPQAPRHSLIALISDRWRLLLALLTASALAGCAGLQGPLTGSPDSIGAPSAAVDTPDSHWMPDRPAIALTPDQKLAFAARRVEFETIVDQDDQTLGRLQTEEPDPRYADLWQRIRAGFEMPELNSPLVARMERFYSDRPDYLLRMMERGSRYLFHIVEEIDKRGLPMELALLPFVESAMNPSAMSPAQASGLWQFIPSTGRAFNLQQDWWVDNRRDVVHSTQAALEYLQKIYELNDRDWFLALASYNWGEGAVGRAVKANRARGRPSDYLSLNMPNETRQYVPRLIALKNILLKSDQLGLRLPPLANRPYFVTVEKTRPIDLKLAARFAGMTMEEFVELNPAHNRPVIAASRNNGIKVPADRVESFLAALALHGETNRSFTTWQPYTMKPGETIENLAARAGITPAELRRANGFKAQSRILAGTRLLLPQAGQAVDDRQVENFVAPRVIEQIDVPALYHTKRNTKETLAVIGRRYGVSVANLTQLNKLSGEPPVGKKLLVRPARTQTIMITEEGRRSVVAAPPAEAKPKVVPVVARPPNTTQPVKPPTAPQAKPQAGKKPTASPPPKTPSSPSVGSITRTGSNAVSGGRVSEGVKRTHPARPKASTVTPKRPAAQPRTPSTQGTPPRRST
ncbi:MAG: Membrane-bound lytic murein transglycosylase precursor [Pseudomonadota bacterium]